MQHSPAFLKLVNEAKQQIRECSARQALERKQQDPSVRLIDVREESEFASGYASQAEHMGRGILERDIEQRIPDQETEIILYCGGGYRSALAAWNLKKMGYRNVFSMAGGIRAWKDEKLPMEHA